MKSLSVEPPHAIITVGIPGSGKTSFAKRFAETFNAPYVQQEYIEQFAQDGAATQEFINVMIEQMVRTKQSLVIDIDTSSRNDRLSLAKYLHTCGYKPLFIWVQTDKGTAETRTRKARKLSSTDYNQLFKKFSTPQPSEHALVISGKHTYSSQAKIVLRKLSSERSIQQPERPASPAPRGKIIIR